MLVIPSMGGTIWNESPSVFKKERIYDDYTSEINAVSFTNWNTLMLEIISRTLCIPKHTT